jgi:hypothetical protein
MAIDDDAVYDVPHQIIMSKYVTTHTLLSSRDQGDMDTCHTYVLVLNEAIVRDRP